MSITYSNKGRAIKYLPTRMAIMARSGFCCAICQKDLRRAKAKDRHIAHLIPRSAGGGNGPENVVLMCRKCNWIMGIRTIYEHLANKPLLLEAILELANTPLDRKLGRKLAEGTVAITSLPLPPRHKPTRRATRPAVQVQNQVAYL